MEKGYTKEERKCVGGRIEGTVPGLGRWDDEKTKLKLSRSKLCSKRQYLSFFSGLHCCMSGLGKLLG